MPERNLEGCNEIINDEACRWLVTVSLVPSNITHGVITETRIIETEPSLWWRSEKWQEYRDMEVTEQDDDGNETTSVQKVPLFVQCLVLNTEYIG